MPISNPGATNPADLSQALFPRPAKLFRLFELDGAGNGIRTRDFNLGKVALYH
jgi:hypothetical protein